MVTAYFVTPSGVNLLDIAGPAEVFHAVGEFSPTRWGVHLIGEVPVARANMGITIAVDTTWPDLAPEDLLIVPGWQTSGKPPRPNFSEHTLWRIAQHHLNGGTVMSVCGGAFVLAFAGLLDGRQATTHHGLQDMFAETFPQVRLVRDVLFVASDRIYTSAGVASGIDLALHVVTERLGPAVASRVARCLVVHARRNGNSPQLSAMLRYRNHVDHLVQRVQDLIEERFSESLTLTMLARKFAVSERTLTRAFHHTIGMTPLQYQQELRRERAELLIAAGETVGAAARMVGYGDARMLRMLRRRHTPFIPQTPQ